MKKILMGALLVLAAALLYSCEKDGDGSNAIIKFRKALSKIINEFNESHHDRHGAHYLIRKSDGALFEWTIEAGAPGDAAEDC